MTYAELFAGAGGMSHGLEAGGFHAFAHAEIEPHARAVLRYRWPDTRLDGDVTKIDGADYAGITLLSGGSPCQDLSVAGKRAGLTGSRSSLFHEQCRIWRESSAPYLLWENVAGAFSSNSGKDFATVLSTIVGSTVAVPADGWRGGGGVVAGRDAVAAWRVLDLQHFGPPQRRVRVFVLAARAGGVDPAEVLALSEGVCGHPSPRQQSREGVTGSLSARTKGGGGLGTDFDLSGGVVATITGNGDAHSGFRNADGIIAFGAQNRAAQGDSVGDVSPSLDKSKTPAVLTFAERGRVDGRSVEVRTDGTVNALMTPNGGRSGTGAGDAVLAFEPRYYTRDNKTGGAPSDVVKVDASIGKNGDAVPIVVGNSGMESWKETEVAIGLAARDAKGPNNDVVGALDFGGHGGSYNGQDAYQGRIRAEHGRPRRLTPLECERLMSWPDQWTAVGRKEDGTEYALSDTARYRLCGNGVGSVCAEWIARRLHDAITGATA